MLESANPWIPSPAPNGGWDFKHEQYSGSPEHNHYLGLSNGADLRHEKGCTVNAALGDDWFFNHEENQHSTELNSIRKPNLVYVSNQLINKPSLRGLARNLCGTKRDAQALHTEIIGSQKLWVTESHSQDDPK
ncbi:hypothetical protein [Pantoea stewartii]|uniref:hypothetical protein n=1 Tax=Pantoea stewartii TaxID=66269 RepID=UPI00113146CB|nr:hypothetical protein [Pantoea stewartii]KAB0557310.1 hypothetical protein F7Q90_07125 [Pantoea stewartii subsp. stewartii]